MYFVQVQDFHLHAFPLLLPMALGDCLGAVCLGAQTDPNAILKLKG